MLALGQNTAQLVVSPGSAVPTTGGPETNGAFSDPFVEPTIDGKQTSDKCILVASATKDCKPAGATVSVLPNGKILYWNALESTENVKLSIVAEFGNQATNDQSRLLTLNHGNLNQSIWQHPTPVDGGANPNGDPANMPLIPGLQQTSTKNDGALFGSHQSWLPDGKLLVQGGTDYSLDPGLPGIPFGASELSGITSTRIYDPATNHFTNVADTHVNRWYPTLVEQGDGKVFEASGVRKLLKPVYADAPLQSLDNVRQTETYNEATNTWTLNPSSADRSLPLYPRLHLLPDGHIFYNAAGQVFNPFGQSIFELNWMFPASYDPQTQAWKTLGIANGGSLTAPGFRGSTFSVMLPLKPDASGNYTKANFLTAGGIIGPSPGTYLATNASDIATIDTTGGADRFSTHATGFLNHPRWYPSGLLLPTGNVMAFSGGDRDEVLLPGTEFGVTQAEMFDPATETWTPMASAHNVRTYHNTAALLPDGSVLVGGHAPISTGYLNNTTIPGGFAPHDGRDPSFEIYKPPYLYSGLTQPTVTGAPSTVKNGSTFTLTVNGASNGPIDKIVLVKNTTVTHLVDGGQRNIELPVVSQSGNQITVKAPPSGNVAPPGPYMLFANEKTPKGELPSISQQVSVQNP
ncbi:MAG: galactose oxidase-like domain-containing protein [Solirubrobacteraceae bacterium]